MPMWHVKEDLFLSFNAQIFCSSQVETWIWENHGDSAQGEVTANCYEAACQPMLPLQSRPGLQRACFLWSWVPLLCFCPFQECTTVFLWCLQDWCGDWDWQCWQWRWHQQTEVVSTTSHCPIERQDARLSRRQGCNWRCLFEWPVGRWPKSHEQPDGHSDAFPAVEDSLHVWHKGFFPPSESTPWWCCSIQIFVVQGSKSLPCHHLSVSLPRLRKPF